MARLARPSAASPGPRGRAGASPSPAPTKAVAKTAKKGTSFFSRHGNVYVYVPNLIGARVRDRLHARRQLGAASDGSFVALGCGGVAEGASAR